MPNRAGGSEIQGTWCIIYAFQDVHSGKNGKEGGAHIRGELKGVGGGGGRRQEGSLKVSFLTINAFFRLKSAGSFPNKTSH